MYDRDDSAPALLSFLIGGIIGASVTCLLAPQSGIVLRRRIREAVDDRAGEAPRASIAGAGKVPEPGLPTDMGGDGRG